MDRGIERDDYEDDFCFFLFSGFFFCMNVMKMIMNMMKNTCLNFALVEFLFCYVIFKNMECMTYDLLMPHSWVDLRPVTYLMVFSWMKLCLLTFLLCSVHICFKDQIYICLYNSRTYLMVF